MWLIDATTLALKHWTEPPPYAILSHQWGADEEEVSFAEMKSDALKNAAAVQNKQGYAKIQACCTQALKNSLNHVWIDTCCI